MLFTAVVVLTSAVIQSVGTLPPTLSVALQFLVYTDNLTFSMERTSSDLKITLESEDEHSSNVLDGVLEYSLPTASSGYAKITVGVDDPCSGMESSGPTEYLLSEDEQNKLDKLKKELKRGLEVTMASLLMNNEMERTKQKVEELFNRFEAIEILIKKPVIEEKVLVKLKADYSRIDIYFRLLMHALHQNAKRFEKKKGVKSALLNKAMSLVKKGSNEGQTDSNIAEDLSQDYEIANDLPQDYEISNDLPRYYESTDFMVFLIKRVQGEEDILSPKLVPETTDESQKKTFVRKCVHLYEKDQISVFICHVLKKECSKAEDFFKGLMKPGDMIDRGRVYNYALQQAEDLLEVHSFLTRERASPTNEEELQSKGLLNWLPMEYGNQFIVHDFLVDLYLKDEELMNKKDELTFAWVEQHDFPYLIKCVWACYQAHNLDRVKLCDKDIDREDSGLDNQTRNENKIRLYVEYAFNSSAAIIGGEKIMKELVAAWPDLSINVNARYKGLTALHVAAYRGNEEVVKYLLEQKELDINERTGLRVTVDEVKAFFNYWRPVLDVDAFKKGILQYKCSSASHAAVCKNHEELVKDLLHRGEHEIDRDGRLKADKYIKRISKGWDMNSRIMNRWKMPPYQTALHIAATQGHAKVVKLLCDPRQRMRCHEEDEDGHTPVGLIHMKQSQDGENSQIKMVLLSMRDIQVGLERQYNNKHTILVNAVNSILVGAALIASVTFGGWLQPPLSYVQYYDHAMPYPAPPDSYDSYIGVQGNLGMKAFVLFNSLSFFFAIATVVIGADAAFPTRKDKFVGDIINNMEQQLELAIKMFVISLIFVLGAFASAALVILPPSLFFRKDVGFSIIIGGVVCSVALWRLMSRRSEKVQWLNAKIVDIISMTNMF